MGALFSHQCIFFKIIFFLTSGKEKKTQFAADKLEGTIWRSNGVGIERDQEFSPRGH
jgi:hypothetical protein